MTLSFEKKNKLKTDRKDKIDFVGIGAAKCGTTWLAQCLSEHPDILFSSEKSRKEITFFSTHSNFQGDKGYDLSTFHKGIDWYLDQFPPPQEGKVRGEFSVSYLVDEESPELIHTFNPEMKIIVILRNPVDMLYSFHNFGKSGAIAVHKNTFEDDIENGDILKFGNYSEYLQNFYDFFPKEQVHVCIFEDIKTDPIELVQDVYDFLRVNNSFVPVSLNDRVNEAFKPRFQLFTDFVALTLRILRKILKPLYFWVLDNDTLYGFYAKFFKVSYKYPPMKEKTRAKLKEYYAPEIDKLENMTGLDLSVWRNS